MNFCHGIRWAWCWEARPPPGDGRICFLSNAWEASALSSDSVTRVDDSTTCVKADLILESDWRVTATSRTRPTLLPAGVTGPGPPDQAPGCRWVRPSVRGDREPRSLAQGCQELLSPTPAFLCPLCAFACPPAPNGACTVGIV